jgi:hypothetical protein
MNEMPLRQHSQQVLAPADFIITRATKENIWLFSLSSAQSNKKKDTRGPFVLLPMECRNVTTHFFCSRSPPSLRGISMTVDRPPRVE